MGCLGVVFPSKVACLGHMSSVDTRQTDPSFTTICRLEVLVGAGDDFSSLLPGCMCLLIGKMTHGSCSLYHREVSVTARPKRQSLVLRKETHSQKGGVPLRTSEHNCCALSYGVTGRQWSSLH